MPLGFGYLYNFAMFYFLFFLKKSRNIFYDKNLNRNIWSEKPAFPFPKLTFLSFFKKVNFALVKLMTSQLINYSYLVHRNHNSIDNFFPCTVHASDPRRRCFYISLVWESSSSLLYRGNLRTVRKILFNII